MAESMLKGSPDPIQVFGNHGIPGLGTKMCNNKANKRAEASTIIELTKIAVQEVKDTLKNQKHSYMANGKISFESRNYHFAYQARAKHMPRRKKHRIKTAAIGLPYEEAPRSTKEALRKDVSEIIVSTTEKILGDEISQEKHEKIISEAAQKI